ncbi:MAG: DUF1549 domain-containing protein [Planctomycetaceae bacterium]|nr:DUF1549 domain-containing protein [Planctomycetaceae bacterium]
MKRVVGLCCLVFSAAPLKAAEVDFAHDVVPILKQHCAECHAGRQKKGGLSLNTRETLLAGGESGPAAVIGKSADSELIQRITSTDESLRMPPEGPRMPADKVAVLTRWVAEGLRWEDGFTFGPRNYEPPLKPRRPELPPAQNGREHPVDRLVDAVLAKSDTATPTPLDDAAFARRSSLDLIGLLPTPEELQTFLADNRPDKRTRWVQQLLSRDVDYAEHWLTFWNDLLRNDYSGTGFITGGRKQISKWLYHALVTNQPYDQFARELIAPPNDESAGFADGIKWRGDVSAGQTVEIQFAQSVGQTFLGINLKCASCHDSFIDRWTLAEAYGLAAIYSTRPLEIHRCDKPIGQTAQAGWLFPELGKVDAAAPQPERLKQLASLMTHSENGRFTRTLVNRLWHRLMGRGIVHPTDAMQTEPWSADLLDDLAVRFADEGYDLKRMLAHIATSQAYQSRAERITRDTDAKGYAYAGPRAKRMTAEQFLDAVWQLTDAAPARIDAPVLRGRHDANAAAATELTGRWIWSQSDSATAAAGETVVFRHRFNVASVPAQAVAAISCDNSYTLLVNGQKVQAGDAWDAADAVVLTPRLKVGQNELLIVAKNAGNSPNPAGLICEAHLIDADGKVQAIATSDAWQWTHTQPAANGKFRKEPDDWQPAALVAQPEIWSGKVTPQLTGILSNAAQSAGMMVRASLVKSDFLMRSLGRPNRDQIVSVRPNDLSTLEAIDLSNGQILTDILDRGSQNLVAKSWASPTEFVTWLYRFSLSRDLSPHELQALTASLGDSLTTEGVQDVLWSVIMLPEFQLVR